MTESNGREIRNNAVDRGKRVKEYGCEDLGWEPSNRASESSVGLNPLGIELAVCDQLSDGGVKVVDNGLVVGDELPDPREFSRGRSVVGVEVLGEGRCGR
jgi:hypothetical protein